MAAPGPDVLGAPIVATAARHLEISARFLKHAEEEFNKGDLLQASEKAWGSVVHYVKSIARQEGWPNRSHRDVGRNADRLIALTDDPLQNELLFKAVENLHVNFYEDTYEDRPHIVEHGIEHARELIGAMKVAGTRLGNGRGAGTN